MKYCFHSSSFHLYSILFIAPASIYTVFFSSLQILFTLTVSFNKSHFYLGKLLCSSSRLLFTQRIKCSQPNFYLIKELLFSSIQLLLKHMNYFPFHEALYALEFEKMDTEVEMFVYRI